MLFVAGLCTYSHLTTRVYMRSYCYVAHVLTQLVQVECTHSAPVSSESTALVMRSGVYVS
jgi:hypothetical protein